MTILPPPPPRTQHQCDTPIPFHVRVNTEDSDFPSRTIDIDRPAYRDGTLWECPRCRRWWKCSLHEQPPHEGPTRTVLVTTYNPEWTPVSAWDIPARRRIAAHETEKWHAQLLMALQRTTARLHWWDCHPNPNRGQP